MSRARPGFFVHLAVVLLLAAGGTSVAAAGDGSPKGSRSTFGLTAGDPLDPPRSSSPEARAGELLVKFRPEASPSAQGQAHANAGATPVREFRALRLHHVKVRGGVTEAQAVAKYRAHPAVEYVEPNYVVRAVATPDDPRFGELWGLAKVEAPRAWDVSTGSPAVVVAVIDSGVAFGHPDLAGNAWTNPGEIPGNGIDDDGNGYADDIHGINAVAGSGDPFDDNGHGTHVAGTIGAVGNNGAGVAGVNWNVRVIACKFIDWMGLGDTAGAIACLQYVKRLKDAGVNIVATNNSWGGAGYSQALRDAIDAQRDILFIAAAGNDSRDSERAPFYPASFELPNLVAVAASDPSDAMAAFSNYGRRHVHLSAPGADIVSTLPDTNVFGIAGGYGALSGTSMAAPHATGLAALLAAADPSRGWASLRNLVLSGGDPVPAFGQMTLTGSRLNAWNSVNCAGRRVFSALQLPSRIAAGVPAAVSALSIECAAPVGPVSVAASGGEPVVLRDDGAAPDAAAGDGVFTGLWTPVSDSEWLTLSSAAGSEVVEFPPMEIPGALLPEANVGYPYNAGLPVSGGRPAFAWALASGALPPGLALQQSGAISGTPTAQGHYPFSARVTDSLGCVAQGKFYIDVVLDNNGVTQAWVKNHVTLFDGNFGGGYGGIAVDDAGDAYVTGHHYLWYLQPYEMMTAGYSPGGATLWMRTDARGAAGTFEALHGIAVGADGALYGAGYSNDGAQTTCLLVKYDAAGNMLWNRTYADGPSCVARAVAVDGAGGVYVTGHKRIPAATTQAAVLTLKYDAAGTLQWASSYGEADERIGKGVAVDPGGNAYVAATEFYKWVNPSQINILLLKYGPQGGLLWTRPYVPADYALYNYLATGIAIDGGGDVHVAGDREQRGSFLQNSWLALKYDSSGTLLSEASYGADRGYSRGIVVDALGNRYLTGDFFLGGDSAGPRLVATVKLDAGGNLMWTESYSRAGYRLNWANGIAVDAGGSVFVTGYSSDENGGADLYTVKYNVAAPLPKAATPVLTPAGGTGLKKPVSVKIGCATPDATIFYTTDGTTPSADNGTALANGGAVTVDRSLTLKAVAVAAGCADSDAASGDYAFKRRGKRLK